MRRHYFGKSRLRVPHFRLLLNNDWIVSHTRLVLTGTQSNENLQVPFFFSFLCLCSGSISQQSLPVSCVRILIDLSLPIFLSLVLLYFLLVFDDYVLSLSLQHLFQCVCACVRLCVNVCMAKMLKRIWILASTVCLFNFPLFPPHRQSRIL